MAEHGKTISKAREETKTERPLPGEERNTGTLGEHSYEERQRYYQEENEKSIEGPTDAQIILGKDFHYGNIGHSKASSMDLVVGRGSCAISSLNEKDKERKWIKQTTKNDSARIYMSQKTNLDSIFQMPKDALVESPKACSGIGMKADTIRMISRHNIRIQSGADNILSSEIKNPEKVGIDLVAGVPFNGETNYNEEMSLIEGRDDMQSIPKGQNLREALEDLAKMLDTLSGVVINFIKIQEKFNSEMAAHHHFETFNGNPGIPSKDVVGPLLENKVAILEECTEDTFEYKVKYLGNFQDTFLNKKSPKYINSKYHRLN